MSDRKKPSSPYVVFENRSLHQWKVTELKEELKRRKLITRGLKDDLVKRLDEAIRAELEEDNKIHPNGVNEPEIPSDDAVVDPIVADKTMDDNIPKNESIQEDNVTQKVDKIESLTQDNITEKLEKDKVAENLEIDIVQEVSVETSVIVSEVMASQESGQQESNLQESNSKPLLKEEEAEPNSSDIVNQVVEVSQVKSDSISIVSITEKNELKDNVIITDDVKLELDVKPSILDDDDDDEKDFKIAETETETESLNVCKKNDILDVGSTSPEKLNLDDDSMEEDALESKQIDSNFTSQEITDKTQIPLLDVMVEDTDTEKPTKRKQYDRETVANSEVVKRQRRWNSNNAPEQTTTPNGSSMKQSFSRSDSSVSHEEAKERVVPISSKPATTSLRVDRFLRPFTLKAVQELLGKTGTVVSFWMDQIKTHCYVTYSSVEEAEETRKALYNLQWPANGGRLLVAEFVDPSEVKTRTNPPPSPTPVTITTTATTTLLPPPSLPLPPPSPLSVPPPPPLPEKLEPPIMTLDDLFRKTRATPRIYYLPLSDEQVAGKLKTQGKTFVKQ